MKKTLFLLIVMSFSQAWANEISEYSEVARLRQYAGGADEGDLKVQPILNQASQAKNKKPPSTESNEGY